MIVSLLHIDYNDYNAGDLHFEECGFEDPDNYGGDDYADDRGVEDDDDGPREERYEGRGSAR